MLCLDSKNINLMIKIASLDDIKENNMIQVELDGDLYLLARNENKVF